MKFAIKLLFLLFCSSAPAVALAAACCGGSLAAPALIVGDERALLNGSYSFSEITDDVGTDSNWRRRTSQESSETLKIDGAHIFADRFQAGGSLPLIRRSRSEEASTGLGDVAGTVGYEFLPDWDYNPWRPRGVGFLQLTAPTGRPIQESESNFQLDSRGRGFWALGAGAVFTKAVGKWDLNSTMDVHRSFNRKFNNSQTSGKLEPGYGGNFGLGGGYNWRGYRFGGSLTWTYEDPVNVRGTVDSDGSAQRFATGTLAASYMLNDEWGGTLTYFDQTLFGAPVNTTLGRGASVVIQKRFLR